MRSRLRFLGQLAIARAILEGMDGKPTSHLPTLWSSVSAAQGCCYLKKCQAAYLFDSDVEPAVFETAINSRISKARADVEAARAAS